MKEPCIILSGTGNAPLAAAVAAELGVSLGPCTIERFPDGELVVELGQSVRGREIYLLQPTAPPGNDHIMELLRLADACRRAAAERVVALVPYFGYARSDRRGRRRTPITASLVAELLMTVGIDQVVMVDVHAPQIEGFFHIPVDNLTAVPRLCAALRPRIPPDAVVVSPDLGAVRLATAYGEGLGLTTVLCHKQRLSGTSVRVERIVGDVRGRACLIVDDMITTGGTVAECMQALKEAGALPVGLVAATHGLLVAGARERLAAAGVRELFVTDTVPLAAGGVPEVHVVSVAPLLARAIKDLRAGTSLRGPA